MLLFGAVLGGGFADEVTELMSSLIDESFDARDLKLIYEETVDGTRREKFGSGKPKTRI